MAPQYYIRRVIGYRSGFPTNLGDVDHDRFPNDEDAIKGFLKTANKLFNIYRYEELECIILKAKDRTEVHRTTIKPKYNKHGILE